MAVTPKELVSTVGDLVSLPEVSVRVNELVNNPRSSTADIGKVISQDPGLTARLLRIANSAFYGFAYQIDTVSRAVTVIGTGTLRDLVLATSATKVFENIPNDLVNMDDFWRHSVYCAVVARILGDQVPKVQGERLFIAGLLHDIGQLIIFNKIPDLAREALLLTLEGPDEPEVHQAERQVVGFDHSQVGGELARAWKLPAIIAEAVEFHHDPEKAQAFPMETAVVHIANSIAILAELNSTDEQEAPTIAPGAWEITGLSAEIIPPTVEEARTQFDEVRTAFFPAGE